MKSIRKTYGVPAKRGGRVVYIDKHPSGNGDRRTEGTITGTRYGQYLRIRLDGTNYSQNYHPTYNIEYLP